MATRGQGYFALYGSSENIKKSSPPKVSGRFSNNFVEMFLGFLGWPSIRFLQTKLIDLKLWLPGGGAYMAKVKENQVSDPGPSWPSCLSMLWCNIIYIKYSYSGICIAQSDFDRDIFQKFILHFSISISHRWILLYFFSIHSRNKQHKYTKIISVHFFPLFAFSAAGALDYIGGTYLG